MGGELRESTWTRGLTKLKEYDSQASSQVNEIPYKGVDQKRTKTSFCRGKGRMM